MSEEIVRIKGTKAGLQLLFAAGATYAAIEAEIREKLAAGSGFFCRGTVMHALAGSLPEEEMEKLRRLFHENGVIFSVSRAHFAPQAETQRSSPAQEAVQAASSQAAAGEETTQMVVVNRTLRGGQEVRTKSSVLVCGNVNPGAQIIAGGSIDIRGTCRGMVHAGAYGNQEAFVIADCLVPTQIRIADLIARAPDKTPAASERPTRPERASIKDGQIVIEPIER